MRRIYEDAGQELGLTKAELDALIELLVDQRMRPDERREADDMAAVAAYRERERQFRREIEDQIGSSRAGKFEEYERTINARFEVEDLRQLFEVASMPLTEAQRVELIRSAIDAGAFVPMFEFTGAEAPAAMSQELLARLEQRDQHFEPIARRVLDLHQFERYQSYVEQRHASLESAVLFEEREASRH